MYVGSYIKVDKNELSWPLVFALVVSGKFTRTLTVSRFSRFCIYDAALYVLRNNRTGICIEKSNLGYENGGPSRKGLVITVL